jgi:hypothetical protein
VIDFNWAFEQLRRSLDDVWRTSFDAWRAMLVALDLDTNEPALLPQPASVRPELALDDLLDGFMARLRSASSGHQFLVFVVTALVDGVRRGSIVLLDEIETHVHPYLLSRTLRVLYDFLVKRGAYAVLATHSPVVLQELPARSIRVVRLDERRPIIKPYPQESLGGSLEDITREGFGVDEGDRSYPTILRELLASAGGDRASECFLEVTFSFGNTEATRDDPPRATFDLSETATRTDFGKVFASHCGELRLLPLYNRLARSYIKGVPGELRRQGRAGPEENTASALAELADALADLHGANYPKAVLYREAARTPEFLAYCRRPSV